MYNYIIVGSGAASVAAATRLKYKNVLILDVGFIENRYQDVNINLLSNDSYKYKILIGDKFEALNNIEYKYMSPKLKGPLMRFITNTPGFLNQNITNNFDPVISYAKGGLANGWGAGCLRFNEDELKDFPYTLSSLNPYYDELTKNIGITGSKDDLTDYLGSTDYLLKPLPLSSVSEEFYNIYNKSKSIFYRHNIKVGRTRSAILSNHYNKRPAYSFSSLDYHIPNQKSIYNPSFTLDEMIDIGAIKYISGYLVTH
jgi:hypothetical protein